MGSHIDKDGEFQSDKYPWCQPGFVPLKLTDASSHDLLWQYAQRRRTVDAEFAGDLELALQAAGFAVVKEPRHWPSGKFTGSTHEEDWNGHETFDTRAEALQHARFDLGAEHDAVDGDLVYTGIVRDLTACDLAEYAERADAVVDELNDYLYENFTDEVCDGLAASPDQVADLAAMLQGTIAAWLCKHQLVPNICHVEDVRSELWNQCECVNERNGGPSSTDRCVLHEGHECEHEFENR